MLTRCQRLRIDPIKNASKITYACTRQWLSDSGYSHFFENTVKIMTIITRQTAIPLTDERKTTLIHHFERVQGAYEKHKGRRRNFLSYAYVTYKFCELFGYTQYMPLLMFYKAPQNLFKAESVWRLMCSECGYEFTPTCTGDVREHLSRSIFVDP
jgi:hypothetical protein